jgi:hypothetical protein
MLDESEPNLSAISRFAHRADDLLLQVKAPVVAMRSVSGSTDPEQPSFPPYPGVVMPGSIGAMGSAETYGATVIRELLPALKSFVQTKNETPEALVLAIATARREGMTDLAMELEQKLVGKKLEGARPIHGKPAPLPLLSLPDASKPGRQQPANGGLLNSKKRRRAKSRDEPIHSVDHAATGGEAAS